MSQQTELFDMLCPFHVRVSQDGKITHLGPTFEKVMGATALGMHFFDVFDVIRPHDARDMAVLLSDKTRRLDLRLRNSLRTRLKVVLGRSETTDCVLNFSFGVGVLDAVRDYALTSADFAATDLAMEMLYLLEAKSIVLNASLRTQASLRGEKDAAEQRAFTDVLTGLVNRRAIDAALCRFEAQATPYIVMHIDLDFFKEVNDTHGHAAGDQVLRIAAKRMLETTRTGDVVGRFGGDEFVILLTWPFSKEDQAVLAQRLINRLEEPIGFQDRMCSVSASIGIAVFNPLSDAEGTTLANADEALYAAKRGGRGQFCFYRSRQFDASSHRP